MNKHVNNVRAEAITAGRQQNKQQYLIIMKKKESIKTGQKKNSSDADKPARRVYRSVKVTKHSTIPHVRYSFLLCNCNSVFDTTFNDIRLQKCNDLESKVIGNVAM